MSGVVFEMGSTGLSSLMWDDQEFLLPGASPAVVQMYGRGDGEAEVWMGNAPDTTTADEDSVIQTFPWGAVTTRYDAPCGYDRLNITVVVENTSALTLNHYWLYPLALELPAVPDATNNPHAFSVDAPAVVFESYGTPDESGGAIALAYDQIRRAAALGLWQAESPAATKWYVSLYVDPSQSLNENWPTVIRPITPGASESFVFSLRFGSEGATALDLAGDIYARYRKVYPLTIRPPAAPPRPIARLSFNGKFRPGFEKNPRGWFNNPDTDVTTAAGVADFQRGLLSAADSSIAEMRRVGALGGVVWDIEGQQLDQSYIGDPSQAEILAPEIIGVLDEFMFRLRDAGFQIGFTLRPQRFTVAIGRVDVSGTKVTWRRGAQFEPAWAGDRTGGSLAFGTGVWYIASVESPTELTLQADAGVWPDAHYFYGRQFNTSHFEEMRRKIQYSRERWGATLFYVDSTLFYSGNLTPAATFERLWELYPDTYIFPEWKTTRHYAYTYPWTDAQLGYIFPDGHTLTTYPDAAGLIRVPADEQIEAKEAELTEAVRAGSILLFDGWYPHPGNDVVMRIYKNAGTQARGTAKRIA